MGSVAEEIVLDRGDGIQLLEWIVWFYFGLSIQKHHLLGLSHNVLMRLNFLKISSPKENSRKWDWVSRSETEWQRWRSQTGGSGYHSTDWLPGRSTCDTPLTSVKDSIMAIILCSNFTTDAALIVYTYFLPFFFSYSKIIQHCLSLLYTMNSPQEKDKSKINHTLTDFTGWMGEVIAWIWNIWKRGNTMFKLLWLKNDASFEDSMHLIAPVWISSFLCLQHQVNFCFCVHKNLTLTDETEWQLIP